MTQAQVATNHAAVRGLLAAFEHAVGHEIPDGLAVAGRAALELLGAGYRRVETLPPRGNGGSDEARAAARQAAADAVAAAKARRLTARPVSMATQRQLTSLAIALAEDGTRERQDRLDWCSALVGRDLGSSSELTRDEASRLIDAVTDPTAVAHELEQNAEPTAVDNPVDDLPPEPDEPWDDEPAQLEHASTDDPIY